MQEDADLDPSRDLPAFAEIMKAGHLDRHYAALWSGEAGDEAMTSVGLDPATHLLRCRELESQGYRMVATSLARTGAYGTERAVCRRAGATDRKTARSLPH